MAIRTEIAELMDKDGVLFEVAEKVNYKREKKKLLKFPMHGQEKSVKQERILIAKSQSL
mgnify:CR=1 FL=1